MAEIPDWLIDELRDASPTAFRLAVVICATGVPLVLPGATRRIYLRMSVDQLAATAGTGKTSTIAALRELDKLGIVRRHRAGKMRVADGVSVGFDPPFHGSENEPRYTGRQPGMRQLGIVHGSESEPRDPAHGSLSEPRQIQKVKAHGSLSEPLKGSDVVVGVSKDLDLLRDPSLGDHGIVDNNNTIDHLSGSESEPRDQDQRFRIRTALGEIGVIDPDNWINDLGADDIEKGLHYLDHSQRRGQWIRNPAGWLRAILTAPGGVPSLTLARDSLEARRRDYVDDTGTPVRDSLEARRRYYIEDGETE